MQVVEIKFTLNDKEFRSNIQIDDKQLAEIAASAKNIKLGYDNTIAKMKLSEVRTEQAKLKAELQEKIRLNMDLGSINETKSKLLTIEESLDGIVRKEKEAGSASGSWSLNITGINQGLELARKAWEMLSVPVQKAAQFEQYEVSMKVMLGSTEAAQKRLAELLTFAKDTPFEMPQVVEAANQLQAIGKYSEETLRNLGDLASASGKPMEQALGAFAKMATGQKGIAVDMFRDLLISVDDWVLATGKGVKATGELEASAEEMLTALPKIIQEKNFAGMMAEQSKTLNGALSNMSDGFGQLFIGVGNKMAPFVKNMVGDINQLVTSLIPVETEFEKASKSGTEMQTRFEQLAFTIERLGKQTKLTEEEQKIYKEALDSLQKEYPNYFRSIDIHAAKYGDIVTAISGARTELDKYIESMIKAGLIQDKVNQIIDLRKEKEKATNKIITSEFDYNTKKESGDLYKEDQSLRQASQLSGSFYQVPTYHELLTGDITKANSTITEADAKINQLNLDIERIQNSQSGKTQQPKLVLPPLSNGTPTVQDIFNQGQNMFGNPIAPSDTMVNIPEKKNVTGGLGGSSNTTKDYLQEVQKDIQEASWQEILTEKAKNQTIYELYEQKKEKEKTLLQSALNLNKDKNSEKLQNEYATAQEDYNITEKLLTDKISEEEKFSNRKAQLLEKMQSESDKEIYSVQLKNQSIEQLDNDLLQAKIERTLIEEGLKNASDAAELDSLEKQRAATTEKINLIQTEIDKKTELQTQLQNIQYMEADKNFNDMAQQMSMLDLKKQILAEETILENAKTQLAQTTEKKQIDLLNNEAKRAIDKKNIIQNEVKVREAAAAQTIIQYSQQYNAQESFGRQANRLINETLKDYIKAKAAEAIASQYAWIMELLPPPLNILALPMAGLAIGAFFDALVPKFEVGGYPEGKNALVQVNENGQEYIMNSQATAKYSGILENMNAGKYQPASLPRYYDRQISIPESNDSGFILLADTIREQTERLEKVERYVKVSELSEGLTNYNTQLSRAGF